MQKTRWGILGLGSIANTFTSDLVHVPNSIIQAVASRNIKKAILFKDKHQAITAYGSYKELANDPNVDVIYIATPHAFHYENTKLCLEHGKAVLCEKPMGMNAKQVLELCAIAKQKKIFLMEAMWTTFLPNFIKLDELVKSKQLGEVKSLVADFGFKAPNDPNGRLLDKSLGGGSILDIGIYPVFAALTLLGEPKNIQAKANIGTTKVDEQCSMHFDYETNKVAHLFCSIIEDTPTEIVIEFEKGQAILGPGFYAPSDLKITDESGKTILYEKHKIGSGYQFEAIHVQNMLAKKATESTIMSLTKTQQLTNYLDIILEQVELKYFN